MYVLVKIYILPEPGKKCFFFTSWKEGYKKHFQALPTPEHMYQAAGRIYHNVNKRDSRAERGVSKLDLYFLYQTQSHLILYSMDEVPVLHHFLLLEE